MRYDNIILIMATVNLVIGLIILINAWYSSKQEDNAQDPEMQESSRKLRRSAAKMVIASVAVMALLGISRLID